MGFYQSEKEQKVHENAIQGISSRYLLDPQWVREIYQQELQQLNSEAKVRRFLSVLSCRHIHERIRHLSSAELASHMRK